MPAVYMVNSVTSMLMIKMMKKIRKKEEDPEEKQGKEKNLKDTSTLVIAGYLLQDTIPHQSYANVALLCWFNHFGPYLIYWSTYTAYN